MLKKLFPLLFLIACGTEPAQAQPEPDLDTIEHHLKILAEMSANGDLAELQRYNPIPDAEIVCLDKECKMVADDFYGVALGCFTETGIALKIANYDFAKHANGDVVKAFTGSDQFKKIGAYLATQARKGKFLRLTSYLSAFGIPPPGIREIVIAFATLGCAYGVTKTILSLQDKQKQCQDDLAMAKSQLAREQELFSQNQRLSESLKQCQSNVKNQEKKLDYIINMTEALQKAR
jgi:hypothetical protein